MKKLELNQMENVEGGSVAAFICGAGFAGYAGIIDAGFFFAGVATGGLGILFDLGVGLVGAAVCSQA